MVAEFYGIRSCTGINDARYQRFCAKGKAPEPQQLPPTEDEWFLHLSIFGNQRCLRMLMQQIRLGMDGAKLEQKHWRLNG